MSDALRSYIRVGGRVFKINLKAESITAEQFILLNKYTTNEATTIENLHYIVAVLTNEVKLFRKRKFDYDYEGKAQLFKEKLSINTVYASSVFFCKVYKKWLEVSETYLIQKVKEMEQMKMEQMI